MNSADLMQFTGTEKYTKWSFLFKKHFLTDGANYVAQEMSAYWLMDAIASYHSAVMSHKDDRLHQFQIWFLKKKKNGAVLECWADTGDDEKAVIKQKFEYTDFFSKYDEEEIKLFVCPSDVGWVIMLPSEY